MAFFVHDYLGLFDRPGVDTKNISVEGLSSTGLPRLVFIWNQSTVDNGGVSRGRYVAVGLLYSSASSHLTIMCLHCITA